MSDFESRSLDLPQGTIRYREAGEGETVVFVHGFLVDGRIWTETARRLADGHRCIVPDWPFGAHRTPLEADADLSPPGNADLIADFLERLELSGVTIVANDSGGAIAQVMVTRRPERVGRLVLTNCDTYEHFPPTPFQVMPPIAKVPGGMTLLSLPFRIKPLARAAFRPFAKHPIPSELVDSWMKPSLSDRGIKRDITKFTAGLNKRYTLEAAEKLAGFDRPTLIAWAPQDRVFALSDAKRLAATIPNARLETIDDAGTFVQLDQPQRLAELIADFVSSKEAVKAGAAAG